MSVLHNRFKHHPPHNILIVCTQRIGDVLLSTPIAHSLKSAWPDANIDYLVLPGCEGTLEGNVDVRDVIVFPQRVSALRILAQVKSVWRRYDLALAAVPTDRARLFAWAAASTVIGFTTPEEAGWLKGMLLNAATVFDNLNTHTVSMGLRLLEPLDILPVTKVRTPRPQSHRWTARRRELGIGGTPYAVVHPNPKFRYKMWEQSKWVDLIDWLHRQALTVFLTGSGDPAEAEYVQVIASAVPHACRSLAGRLSLAETAELLREARLFVGPDTAVTHLAAAAGTPTIALFGPSNPVKWGPWPSGRSDPSSPWSLRGSTRQGNVWLIQGEDPAGCVPCLLEGCDRHLESNSRCLTGIAVERIQLAARDLLGSDHCRITPPG